MSRWARNGSGAWALGPRAPLAVLATLTAAGAAAAAGYGLTAPARYRATAQLIVSPVPAADATFTGIDVLRDTGGKRTAAASAAALVRTPLVADAVRALLGVHRSRDSLLAAIDVHVAGASDVVDVTAEDTSAEGAAQLANAFADTLVSERSATFQSEVAAALRRYRQQFAALAPADRRGQIGRELERRLVELRTLQNQPDPSLAHAGQAAPPTSRSWPNVAELVAIGAGAGAALGALAALALAALRGRHGAPVGLAAYDRPMEPPAERPGSDVALERLVDGLEARFAARESALLARERDLQAMLREVRAAQAAAAEAADGDLALRERELEERVAAVTRRELELARRAAELAVRERAAASPQEPEPQPEAEPARPAPVEAPAPRPPAARDGAGTFNLLRLERLVEERGGEFPERADEWASYLYLLREYAGPDGSVPASFDGLIQDTFAELVS